MSTASTAKPSESFFMSTLGRLFRIFTSLLLRLDEDTFHALTIVASGIERILADVVAVGDHGDTEHTQGGRPRRHGARPAALLPFYRRKHPFGRICRSSSAGLLPKGRKNPTAMSISICNAILRTSVRPQSESNHSHPLLLFVLKK